MIRRYIEEQDGEPIDDEVLEIDSLFAILEKYLPIDLPLVADVGESLFGALDMMIRRPENFISDPYYLSMGFALPASIGVMAARDTKRAIIVVGDGAFQMSCTELSTAAKYGMYPIVIVINNDGYSTQRGIIDGSFNDIQRWNYQLMPDLINSGQGVSVVTPQGFADSLEKALDYNGIFVINAIVPRNDHSHTLRKLGQSLKAKRNQTQHLI